MKNILKEIKYWSQIFLLPVYASSYIMPRSGRIWVLGSTFGRRFADNPKYFYLYLNQYRSDRVRAVWITKNREVIRFLRDNGLEGYYLYTFKGIWYSLRAGVYLYDNYSKDICFTLSGGAVKINLWHGIPLKKIQKDNVFDRVRNPRTGLEKFRWLLRRLSDEKPTDYIVAPSEFMKPVFSSAFRTKNVLVCGYPRNDVITSGKLKVISTDAKEHLEQFLAGKKADRRIILYMPTFRGSETRFFDILSVDSFNEFLSENRMLFCVKLHPKSKLQARFREIESNNILVLDSQSDVYPLLKLTDMLVTDYSSIYFDYLLMKKPVIFFPYDYEEYLRDSRELYFDYEEFTPGIKVYNQKQLEEALLRREYDWDKADKICRRVFDDTSSMGSEQLYELIQKFIK